MVKQLFFATGLVIAVFPVILFALAFLSRSGSAPGLVDGRLTRCSPKPNGVCSEFPDDSAHFVEPLPFISRQELREVIKRGGGTVVKELDSYVASTFSSSFFGFVDDCEFRLDYENNVIHVRSVSRVGYSDLGVNRKRVDKLRSLSAEYAGK